MSDWLVSAKVGLLTPVFFLSPSPDPTVWTVLARWCMLRFVDVVFGGGGFCFVLFVCLFDCMSVCLFVFGNKHQQTTLKPMESQ